MSNAPNPQEDTSAGNHRAGKRRFRPWRLLALPVLLLAAWFTGGYLHYDNQFASTEDAFVGADQVRIGPQVSGIITRAPCHNNRLVQQGELLFAIDPTPFKAQLAAAEAKLRAAEREQATAQAAVATAKATLSQRKAEAHSAHDHLKRLENLRSRQFVSAQELEDARSQADVADSAVTQAQAALDQAKANAGAKGDRNDRILAAKAAIASAEYDLTRTRVTAPMSGILANYGIEVGQTVAANQALFSIVATRGLWVDANFKETEVGAIHIGDRATIHSDLYPNRSFSGHVISIAGGSGNAFSLLPPENATGNWVKVTQRVPVRVVFDDANIEQRLPIGTSTTVRVSLTSHPQGLWRSLLDVVGLSHGTVPKSAMADGH